jgi:hypothetical protein
MSSADIPPAISEPPLRKTTAQLRNRRNTWLLLAAILQLFFGGWLFFGFLSWLDMNLLPVANTAIDSTDWTTPLSRLAPEFVWSILLIASGVLLLKRKMVALLFSVIGIPIVWSYNQWTLFLTDPIFLMIHPLKPVDQSIIDIFYPIYNIFLAAITVCLVIGCWKLARSKV